MFRHSDKYAEDKQDIEHMQLDYFVAASEMLLCDLDEWTY